MNVTHWQLDRSLHCMNSCHLFVYLSIPTVKLCNIKRNQGMKSVFDGKIGAEPVLNLSNHFPFQWWCGISLLRLWCVVCGLVCVYICLLSQRRKEVFNIKSISCLSSSPCGRSSSSPVLLSRHCESSRGKIYEESLERAESNFL